jgi:hypothetical protein
MSDEINEEPNAGEPLDPPPDSTGSAPSSDRAAAEQDLKATADSIRSDAGRLAALEDDKLALDADDPEVGRLSDDAIELASRIVKQTSAERQLSQEIG